MAVFLASACSTSQPPVGEPGPDAATAADGSPGLKPGDAIALKVYRERAMSDTIQVDEDGTATFPLIGTQRVAGMTVDSLKRSLRAQFGEYLKDPVLEIRVLRRISIFGAVQQPGLYPVDPTIGLSEALALAGGPTGSADPEDIRLIRDGRVVKRTSFEETARVDDLRIRSGDRIWVGKQSWFARNWQWVAGTAISASLFIFTR